MPDQTITLTLHEKVETENFIKISYTANDGTTTTKEIQLTGDQESDNKKMIDLFSDLLPQDFIEQYKIIKSQLVQQSAVKQNEDKQQKNAEQLKKQGIIISYKMSVSDIISALSNNNVKVKIFNRYIIETLLNVLTDISYNKYINRDILAQYLKSDFLLGINLHDVKAHILHMAEETSYKDNNNLIDSVFKPEFLKKYSRIITTWGREVLLSSDMDNIKFYPTQAYSIRTKFNLWSK
jgi:hypothetical protein